MSKREVRLLSKGLPGHFIGCMSCCFSIHTEVRLSRGGRGAWYRVSTVGCYHPGVAVKDRTDANRDTLGSQADSWYETMVFLRDGLSELDTKRYADAAGAELGHASLADKYAKLLRVPR